MENEIKDIIEKLATHEMSKAEAAQQLGIIEKNIRLNIYALRTKEVLTIEEFIQLYGEPLSANGLGNMMGVAYSVNPPLTHVDEVFTNKLLEFPNIYSIDYNFIEASRNQHASNCRRELEKIRVLEREKEKMIAKERALAAKQGELVFDSEQQMAEVTDNTGQAVEQKLRIVKPVEKNTKAAPKRFRKKVGSYKPKSVLTFGKLKPYYDKKKPDVSFSEDELFVLENLVKEYENSPITHFESMLVKGHPQYSMLKSVSDDVIFRLKAKIDAQINRYASNIVALNKARKKKVISKAA